MENQEGEEEQRKQIEDIILKGKKEGLTRVQIQEQIRPIRYISIPGIVYYEDRMLREGKMVAEDKTKKYNEGLLNKRRRQLKESKMSEEETKSAIHDLVSRHSYLTMQDIHLIVREYCRLHKYLEADHFLLFMMEQKETCITEKQKVEELKELKRLKELVESHQIKGWVINYHVRGLSVEQIKQNVELSEEDIVRIINEYERRKEQKHKKKIEPSFQEDQALSL